MRRAVLIRLPPSAPPVLLLLLALAVRLLVAARVYIPGRDGATYLWMAERVAQGDFAASFQTVFPPVYPWLVAPFMWLWPEGDPVWIAQVVSGVCGALAVWPLWLITCSLFGARAATVAGFFYAVGTWFARHPADCMSEGPFYLLVTSCVLALVRGSSARSAALAGALCGVAFGTRPEGAALAVVGVPWLWLHDRKRSVVFAVSALAVGFTFPIGYALFGDGFTLTPKAAFNLAVGAGHETGGGVIYYLTHLLRVPGHVFEAIGYVAAALAGYGAWRGRPRRVADPAALLLGLFALQVLVVPLVRATIRFVSGYGTLLLPFAGLACVLLAPRLWPRAAWARVALVLLVIAPDLVRIPQAQREEKLVLRELGEYLGARMGPGELLASAERRARSSVDLPFSMCRVEFFAGVEPSPPRPLHPSEILAKARDPRARFALITGERPGVTVADLEQLGYRPHSLPSGLAERASARSIAVFARSP